VLTPIITQQRKGKTNMSINLKNKTEIVKAYGKNEKDTGSSAVQIAMMTQKISELTEHLKSNKKDFATKRGLLMMVGKRKRLLAYVKSQNLDEYRELIKKLGIRG
jgi:small subunit ribosomal protein S15